MSDIPDIIKRPARIRVTVLREDYLGICDGNATQAKLLNIMERWHKYKLENRDQARHQNKVARQGGKDATADEGLWVSMPVDTQKKNVRARSWVKELLGEYSYKTVLGALTALEERGFVQRRDNPREAWDRTPQWLFNVRAVQAAVDTWDAQRVAPELDNNPDGVPEVDDEHSADVPESNRQNYRMESAECPEQ